MIPEEAPPSGSHDQSHDQKTTPINEGPTFQQMLSSAIRVSLSGETEEMEVGVELEGGEGVMMGEGEGEEEREGGRNLSTPPVELLVPEDLPVDLRVKLAVCLIHLSLPLPPSLLPPVTSDPEEYGDLFIDLAEAYTEMSESLPLA